MDDETVLNSKLNDNEVRPCCVIHVYSLASPHIVFTVKNIKFSFFIAFSLLIFSKVDREPPTGGCIVKISGC